MTREQAKETIKDIKEPFTGGYVTAIIDGIYDDFEEQLKHKCFEDIAKDMIKYLNDNHHPHARIIVDSCSCEVLEGLKCFYTLEYLKKD